MIKETFRLRPPAPLSIPHLTDRDTQVEGWSIPRNTIIISNGIDLSFTLSFTLILAFSYYLFSLSSPSPPGVEELNVTNQTPLSFHCSLCHLNLLFSLAHIFVVYGVGNWDRFYKHSNEFDRVGGEKTPGMISHPLSLTIYYFSLLLPPFSFFILLFLNFFWFF